MQDDGPVATASIQASLTVKKRYFKAVLNTSNKSAFQCRDIVL